MYGCRLCTNLYNNFVNLYKFVQICTNLYNNFVNLYNNFVNLYKVDSRTYDKLLQDNITASYKKTDSNTAKINNEAKAIRKKLKLENRIETLKARFHYERGKKDSLFALLISFCARFNFNRSLQSKINKKEKECSFPRS